MDYTYTSEPDPRYGFHRVLYFYARGPSDPPGNQYVWRCLKCDQSPAAGHLSNCPISNRKALEPAGNT